MLPMLAQISVEAQDLDQRGALRRTLQLETPVANDLSSWRVVINNLSETGISFETSLSLALGDILEIGLPEVGSVDARVVWTDGNAFGCQFLSPISKAAVSAALLLSPFDQASEQQAPATAGAWTVPDLEPPVATRPLVTLMLVALAAAAVLFIVAQMALPVSSFG